MNEYQVKRLALVLSIQAEIEAMKLQNELCKLMGDNPEYMPYHFTEKAEKLEQLAYAHDEQLFS